MSIVFSIYYQGFWGASVEMIVFIDNYMVATMPIRLCMIRDEYIDFGYWRGI